MIWGKKKYKIINLSYNSIKESGAQTLFNSMKEMKLLTQLIVNVKGNEMKDLGA